MARIPLLLADALREVESLASGWSPALMTRAGEASARLAGLLAAGRGGPVVVAVGPGNNGGDGWVAAAALARLRRVVVVDVFGTEPKAAEAIDARDALRARGYEIRRDVPVAEAALVIDALLGIGLTRDVDGALAIAIAAINDCHSPVLSLDVPSGLDAMTGVVRGSCVRATHTLTFIADKPGLHTNAGPDHAGRVHVDNLGAGDLVRERALGCLLRLGDVRMPARAGNAHKGTFGTLGIVGGNAGMVGAALLAGRAALFAGAGKVRVALLDAVIPVDPVHPELMLSSLDETLRADVVLVGPGGGAAPEGILAREVLSRAIDLAVPLVLDADALNVLARDASLRDRLARRTAPTVVTPHPAEAARLLGSDTSRGSDSSRRQVPDPIPFSRRQVSDPIPVQADRVAAALALARLLRASVVLKGAGSVCAFSDGRWSINTTGNPGLASAGTGDVLAGVVGALLAQRLAPGDALELAVCVHGAAADALVARGIGPAGLTASEVACEIRAVLGRAAL